MRRPARRSRDEKAGQGEGARERRRNVLLLRWLSIVTTSYLLLFSPGGSGQPLVSISILLLLVSNVVLHCLRPTRIFEDRTLIAIALLDTSITSIAVLSLTAIEPHVLIFYFFVILQAAVGRSFRTTLVSAVATSALALVLNRNGSPRSLSADVFLWVPFIICPGMFFAYLSEQLREDRERELERARDAALEASRMKSSFVRNMSHEIRTPVTVIVGYIRLIGEQLETIGDEAQRALFEAVERNSTRLLNTVHGILDISRMESGSFQIHPERIELGPFIEEKVAEFRKLAEDKGLSLTERIDARAAAVTFDEYSLSRALASLLDNAIKFTAQGNVLVWLGRSADGRLSIEVRDTGVGIDPAYLPHLYEAFSQEKLGSARPFEGSGLGMALAREFLELNGAAISVESQKGKGTRFAIHFPKACEATTVGTRVETVSR
ncbi:MAG TPA: HAMP domain-containing sensor histidine kinase [Candidatus Binatia bacterium]|nr:HAMP domain-containing sensor histidine kinase [Candidatus Binatia bacterium]